MRNFWFALLIIFSFFVAAVSGFLLSNYLNSLEISDNTDWGTIGKDEAGTKFSVSELKNETPNPNTTCMGCTPNPESTNIKNGETVTKNFTSGYVNTVFKYTPDYYSLSGGKPVSATELIYDILRRHDLGHLTSSVSIPNISYYTPSVTGENNKYFIRKDSVRIAKTANVSVIFSVRIPTLSEIQYETLKNTKDYRLIYGLIKGIVRHEEYHYEALRDYARDISTIINSPLTEDIVITAKDANEMRNKLNSTLAQSVKVRLNAARAKHENAQGDIDDTAINHKITFNFEDKIGNDTPAPIVGEFRGKAEFDFSPLPTPAPKPPVPTIFN